MLLKSIVQTLSNPNDLCELQIYVVMFFLYVFIGRLDRYFELNIFKTRKL